MCAEKINTVGIICPEKGSFNYCYKIFALDQNENKNGRNIAYTKSGSYEIYSIYSEKGKIKNAAAAQFLIDNYDPQIIIDTGMSFSLSDKLDFYSVIIGEKGFEYDTFSTAKVDQIPSEYITSTLVNNDEAKDKIRNYMNNKRDYEGISFGSIASAEKEVDSRIFSGLLRSRFDTSVWSNSTSAVLKVAEINEIKTMSFKVVLSKLRVGTGERVTGSQKQGYTKLYRLLKDFIDDGVIDEIYNINKQN
ncbi:MAG: hypothetical protein ACOCP5_03930 [Halanaerobiaceae bacterium]